MSQGREGARVGCSSPGIATQHHAFLVEITGEDFLLLKKKLKNWMSESLRYTWSLHFSSSELFFLPLHNFISYCHQYHVITVIIRLLTAARILPLFTLIIDISTFIHLITLSLTLILIATIHICHSDTFLYPKQILYSEVRKVIPSRRKQWHQQQQTHHFHLFRCPTASQSHTSLFPLVA